MLDPTLFAIGAATVIAAGLATAVLRPKWVIDHPVVVLGLLVSITLAAGAALVFLGGAMAVPALRAVRVWGPGVLIGALAGLLLLPAGLSSDYGLLGPLCLLVIWQASVAAWFGRGLAAD